MQRTPFLVGCILLAGCASSPAVQVSETPRPLPESDKSYGPAVPASVRVERALLAMERGDDSSRRRARAALLAQESDDLAPLRARVAGLSPDSPLRSALLAVLAERGEDLRYLGAGERVIVDLRVIAHGEGYGTLRALSRLEAMGEEARAPLERLAGGDSPEAGTAQAVLKRLFGPDRDSRGERP